MLIFFSHINQIYYHLDPLPQFHSVAKRSHVQECKEAQGGWHLLGKEKKSYKH